MIAVSGPVSSKDST